jgi:2-keto-3-deoxy-L-rhamnonate aldolase RhmA
MVDLLKRGASEFGYCAVKAEFEAEGTRTDELLRLVEIAYRAGLPLTVKIGGCEAIRDLLEAKQIGVQFIVAPMVETPYALSKYVAAKSLVYSPEESQDVRFLFNIETETGFANRVAIIDIAKGKPGVDGVVFGRVDFVGSMGRHRDSINHDDVTSAVVDVAALSALAGLDLVVGGGISIDAIPALRRVREIGLTRFETRKVVFSGSALDRPGIERGLLNAVHFELLWLINKREYYGTIHREDMKRIEMLEERWNVLKSPAG